MIYFFKMKRWLSIKNQKFFKYSKYAIGEILIVIIGIIVALLLHNWNEKRKDRDYFNKVLAEVENFDFGIELDASKTNDLNQGWGSNSKLQGKWFKLTYFYKEQQLYIDGPMGTVRIINKAILD
mgnify:CR=1 FL=1